MYWEMFVLTAILVTVSWRVLSPSTTERELEMHYWLTIVMLGAVAVELWRVW